jgi:hypothetical protein
MKLLLSYLLFSIYGCAWAADVFDGKNIGAFKRSDVVNGAVTIGRYPIYAGENQWKIETISVSEGSASGNATPITSGTVIFNHFEPNGDWFASMKVTANLNTGGANQYFTGSPCSGNHLFVVNKGRGKNDDCLVADVGSSTQGTKSTTYFDINVYESKSSGRLYVLGIRLSAELLGFRETSVTDWSRLALEDSPYRSAFVTRLQAWAEKLQSSANNALDFTPPVDAFNGLPSWRTLLPVPSDLELGAFSQQFIGAVESTRNKPKSHAIAYSKVSPSRIRWGNAYAKASQELANKEALETCEKNRPASDEPCRLFDLDANVTYSVAKTPADAPSARPAKGPAEGSPIETKLIELKSLLDKGLITNEIFEKKREQLLNSL